MDTQKDTNTTPTWQERHVSTDCKNCRFFAVTKEGSRFGVCQCTASYFFSKSVFQDAGCAKFVSRYGG
jgi:hypothetical protein